MKQMSRQEYRGSAGEYQADEQARVARLNNSSPDVSCVSDINSVYERIRLEKLTFAHRAVSVSTDPSGCNFAVLQSDPKTR